MVPLERSLYGHPLGGLLWERQFESSIEPRMGSAAAFLLTFRSLVITSAIFDETRGKIIVGRFWSINARAQQERSVFSGTVDRLSIKKPYNGYHSQWRSANTGGSNTSTTLIDLFVQILEDTPAALSHGKTLRRSRIFK